MERGTKESSNGEKVVSEQVSKDVYVRVIGDGEMVNGNAEEENDDRERVNDDEKKENGVKEASSDPWLEGAYGFLSISKIAEQLWQISYVICSLQGKCSWWIRMRQQRLLPRIGWK